MPRRISIAALGLCLLTAAALHGCTSRLGEGTEPMDCSDYADNDADGLFDCADPGCEAAPACQPPPLSDAFELGPQLECMSPYEGIDRFSEEGLQRGLTVIVEEGGNGGSTVPRRALGGALALSDLDGDGDFDIIQGPKTFYENDGAAHFTELPGLTTEDSPTDTDYMAAVDLDGDGLPELIGARNIPPEIVPQVWHNLGDFQFEQIQQLDVPHSGHELSNQTISLADIDGDNDLDLAYITGGVDPSTGGGYPTTLYRYDFEAGLFEQWFHLYADSDSSPASDVSSQVGLFTDHDRDGDPDLYIANDFGNLGFPSALWRNDGTDGSGTPVQRRSTGGRSRACDDRIWRTGLRRPEDERHGYRQHRPQPRWATRLLSDRRRLTSMSSEPNRRWKLCSGGLQPGPTPRWDYATVCDNDGRLVFRLRRPRQRQLGRSSTRVSTGQHLARDWLG